MLFRSGGKGNRRVHFKPMTSSFAPFPLPKADMKAGESVSGNTPLTGNPSNGLSVAAGISCNNCLIVGWQTVIVICMIDE